jgi:hypothetical protein
MRSDYKLVVDGKAKPFKNQGSALKAYEQTVMELLRSSVGGNARLFENGRPVKSVYVRSADPKLSFTS